MSEGREHHGANYDCPHCQHLHKLFEELGDQVVEYFNDVSAGKVEEPQSLNQVLEEITERVSTVDEKLAKAKKFLRSVK